MPRRPNAGAMLALRCAIILTPLFTATAQAEDARGRSLEAWLGSEQVLATAKISANLLPNGAVLASPSRSAPDYYYHWTRDAALTMDVVLDLYSSSNDPAERAGYLQQLQRYVDFVVKAQAEPSLSGSPQDHFANLGEPKFTTDGKPYAGSWGRPQTDGPALRALSLMRLYALSLQRADAQAQFADNLERIKTAILADLEYTTYHWNDFGFDLWEESRGHHFYNALVQRRALLAGADFVRSHADGNLAERYRTEAQAVDALLARFWDEGRGYLVETLDRNGGLDYKTSNLDTGIVLAALHAQGQPAAFGADDDRILATAHALRAAFAPLYPINAVNRDSFQHNLAPAIGRYPEDRYDGIGTSQGHPWFLTTAALAEINYRAATAFQAAGKIQVTARNEAFFRDLPLNGMAVQRGDLIRRGDSRLQPMLQAMLRAGDEYLARVRLHAADSGELTEEMDRYSGFERGASDLSWSYASLLTAARARVNLLEALR